MEEGLSEFESGYEQPAVTPEVTTEVKPEEPKPVEAEAQIEPEQKPEEKPDPLQEVLDRMNKLEQRTRNAEGHIGGLTHNQKVMRETLEAASKAATKQVAESPTTEQVNEAIGNPKEWEDLKADFPEWAVATDKFVEFKLASKGGKVDVEAIRKQIKDEIGVDVGSIRQEIADSALEAVFPGWKNDVKAPEFKTWMDAQNDEIKALAASDKVGDAAKMLKAYGERTKKTETRKPDTRKALIEAAVTPKGTGGFTPSRSAIDEFESGYSTG